VANSQSGEVTRLLVSWSGGVAPLVYDEPHCMTVRWGGPLS